MKEKRSSIANVICFILVLFFTFACSSLSFAADGDSLEVANPSKGITLLKNADNEVNGINLNGNSVVIKDSSVSGKVNFFIDKNCNGKVDSGENAVALPDITGETTETSKDVDVSKNVTIYGLYNAVYNGDLKISIEATSEIYSLKGIYQSHLKGSETITVNNGVVYELKGVEYSRCDGDFTFVSDGGAFTSIHGIYGTTTAKSEVGGDVKIDISDCKTMRSSLNIIGVYYSDVKGGLDIDFGDAVRENTMPIHFYGAYDSTVGKDVDMKYQVVNMYYIYGMFNSTATSNANISIDIGKNENVLNSGCIGGVSAIYASGNRTCYAKKVDVNIHDLYRETVSGDINAIYGFNQTGHLSSSGDVTVLIKNISNISNVYGDQYVTAAGNIKTTLENIKGGRNVKASDHASCAGDLEVSLKNISCSSSAYGTYSPNSGGNIKITLGDVEGGFIAGTYADNSAAGGCKKDLDVTLTNCVNYLNNSYTTIYAAYSITCGGSATIKSVGSKGQSIFLANSLNSSGGITATSKGDEMTSTTGTYYGSYASTTGGTASITIEDAKLLCLTASGVYAKDGADTIVKNSEIYGSSICPVSTGKSEYTEEIQINNVKFSNVTVHSLESDESTKISNDIGAGSAAEVVFDDDCVLPDNVKFQINRMVGYGYSSIKYKNSLYVGGYYAFNNSKFKGIDNVFVEFGTISVDENVKIKNLAFVKKENVYKYSSIVIPKGKTLEVTNDFSTDGVEIVLEGTLKATAKPLASGEKSTVKWYLNGGSSNAIRDEDIKYYPIYITMTEYAGKLTVYGAPELEYYKNVHWAEPNDSVSLIVEIADKFHFGNATVKGESEETATEITDYSDKGYTRTYKFRMLGEKVYVNIVCEGDDVNISTSVEDPIAKTDVLYTVEKPLYDFSSLVITGDIEEGSIKSEVAPGYSLPYGLYIKDNKIIGKVSSENEGVDVKFIITARNGAKDEVTLKIVVEKSEEVLDPENSNNKDENKNDKDKDSTKKSGSSKPSTSKKVKYGPAKGTKIADKKLIYKVTKVGSKDGKIIGEVEVIGAKNKKAKSVKIAAYVTIDGVKYKVTSIGKKAFKGNKKLKKVTIGSNVQKIGSAAFSKCKKLKKVTIKSNVLKKVAKGSFKGVKKSCKIKVPKAKKKAYKKMFKKAKCKAKVK